jgi:hypothetical protein
MLVKLQSETRELAKQREVRAKEITRIDKRFLQLTQSVDALSALLKKDEESDLDISIVKPADIDPSKGITEAIRKLYENNAVLSPTLIRGLLTNAGFEDTDNFLVVIHNTLKRMADNGELRPVEMEGKTAYEWVGPTERFANTMAIFGALGDPGAHDRLSLILDQPRQRTRPRKSHGRRIAENRKAGSGDIVGDNSDPTQDDPTIRQK